MVENHSELRSISGGGLQVQMGGRKTSCLSGWFWDQAQGDPCDANIYLPPQAHVVHQHLTARVLLTAHHEPITTGVSFIKQINPTSYPEQH
jgi:hypothetical protein